VREILDISHLINDKTHHTVPALHYKPIKQM